MGERLDYGDHIAYMQECAHLGKFTITKLNYMTPTEGDRFSDWSGFAPFGLGHAGLAKYLTADRAHPAGEARQKEE